MSLPESVIKIRDELALQDDSDHSYEAFKAGFNAGFSLSEKRAEALVELAKEAKYVGYELHTHMSGPSMESKSYKIGKSLYDKACETLSQYLGEGESK